MRIQENFSLKEYSYMKIGGLGAFLIEIDDENDIENAIIFAREKELPIHVLGHGSNSIFSEAGLKKVFIKLNTKNIIKTYENNEFVNISVDSGVPWDDLVSWAVDNNLVGLEALSLIPGSVGASPIQNIGAYGQEVSNVITNVKVIDLQENQIFDMPNLECKFNYRTSIFKQNPSRFLILKVSFNLKKLTKDNVSIPEYKDIKDFFAKKKNNKPTLKEIRNAIIDIRNSKLPDPKIFPNCGSFFENPVVDKFELSKILMKRVDMPHFDLGNKTYKLYAGWLIENAGLKGHDFGKLKISGDNALVLINHKEATFFDLINAIEIIKQKVKEEFYIDLQVEPNLIIN
jgi:UDP-N-acetylmuramate dehydrogenase